jgi:hypothetical protein
VVQFLGGGAPDLTVFNPSNQLSDGDDGALTWWSLYVTRDNTDLPFLYFYRAAEWLDSVAVRGGFASERGGKKKQLHLQGLALIRAPPTDAGKTSISDSIKKFFPIPERQGYKVNVKLFEAGQTPLFMLGYIQKDAGEAHFNLSVKGFSSHDCIVGRAIHFTQVSSFEQGKSKISKSAFIAEIHSYYTQNLFPLPLSVCQILRLMIVSGSHLPGQTWLTPGQGRGCALDKASIHFKWASHPTACTVGEIQAYFFDGSNTTSIKRLDRSSMHKRRQTEFEPNNGDLVDFIPIDGAWTGSEWVSEDSYDDISLAAAKERAFERRRSSGGAGIGIDGIDMDDFEADTSPFDKCTIVAKDGVHLWNRTPGVAPDMNDSLAMQYDATAEFDMVKNVNALPSEPISPAPEYEVHCATATATASATGTTNTAAATATTHPGTATYACACGSIIAVGSRCSCGHTHIPLVRPPADSWI